jgi:hypothetical protein
MIVPDATRMSRNGSGDKLFRPHTMDETAVELGVWLSGIESFLSARHTFEVRLRDVDASKELELTHSVLERCLLLCTGLEASDLSATKYINNERFEYKDVPELTAALRSLVSVGECLRRAEPIGTVEWHAWRDLLQNRIGNLPAALDAVRFAEHKGQEFLPEPLLSYSRNIEKLDDEQAELALVLPRFAKILKWLSIVGKMLETDEPLKPGLLILARVNEQVQGLIAYLNNRLERFPDKGGEIFASLDGASYLASIELKKVYTQELSGLIRVRPVPTVYSGMETAYSVLNESFQQIVAGMCRFVDPSVDSSSLFPSFKQNFEKSLSLRRELWNLVRLTQAAEANPDRRRIQSLNNALSDFMEGPIRYLFYKDTETVERFIEEITVAKQERDLVPILHRFGAYLETLFGQVNMRAVLESHPFQPSE